MHPIRVARAIALPILLGVIVFAAALPIAKGDDWRAQIERCVEQPVGEYISLEYQVWMTAGTGGVK